jgi:hypothetical protein
MAEICKVILTPFSETMPDFYTTKSIDHWPNALEDSRTQCATSRTRYGRDQVLVDG